MNVKVDEESAVKIASYDLCRLLHNLIDNSINAAARSNDCKKSEIKIVIETDYISITTVNGFNESNTKKKVIDKNHGYGLNIIKEICKKYEGNYSSHIDGKDYFTITKLKNISC